MPRREEQLKEEISRRLRRALERAGDRSVRSLEKAMRDRDADVRSYASINGYVKGEKLAPVTFLVEAADELGVRPEWLVLGTGEMTAVEEQLGGEAAAAQALASLPGLEGWPERAREVFVELFGSYVLQAPDHHEAAETETGAEMWAELAQDLVLLTTLPLRSWGFRDLEDLDERERFAYLLSVLNSLLVAVEGKEDGDALSDHAESLVPRLRRAAEEPPELTQAERERAERLQAEIEGRA